MSRSISMEQAKYLFALQESGVTNMWGAPRFVSAEFEVGPAEAKRIVLYWMDNYESLKQWVQQESEARTCCEYL